MDIYSFITKPLCLTLHPSSKNHVVYVDPLFSFHKYQKQKPCGQKKCEEKEPMDSMKIKSF